MGARVVGTSDPLTRGPEDLHGYAGCTKAGHVVAGLMPALDPSQPSLWTVYLATDDLDATLAKVVEAGGTMMTQPIDVGGLGRMALATDPGVRSSGSGRVGHTPASSSPTSPAP